MRPIPSHPLVARSALLPHTDACLAFVHPHSYKVGEAFLHMPHARATKRLEHDQAQLDAELSALSARAEACETEMKELKVMLYAKFGRAINLDE